MRDLLLAGGQVFDGHRRLGSAAVLVVDGDVAAVGDVHELRPRAPRAEEVDVAGGLVCPGFEDAHVHPMVGGLERLRCDLTPYGTREEYLDAIGRYAASTRTWSGSAGAAGRCPPSTTAARSLRTWTAWSRDRPVFLPSNDHHDAWVSSRALEIAGVDARTPDPGDGWLLRDEQGRPTGTLREAAMSLVHRHVVTEPRRVVRRCWKRSPSCTRSGSPAGRTRCSAVTRAR